MATVRLQLLLRFKNSARLFSSSAALMQRPWTNFSDDTDVSSGGSAVYMRALKLQRPTTIVYEKSLRNSVRLIGAIELPFKICNSARFGVHTLLKVNASSRPYHYFSVLLKFWDEMAEMSVQHLNPNDLVYVSGRLTSYMKEDENGKPTQKFEVVVKEVNFVSQNDQGPACQNLINRAPEVSWEEIKQKRRDRLHLWQIFFANPSEWWDDRNWKRNPNAPDFKHKDTGEVLWLTDNDPPWVHKQLQLHDSRLYKRSPGEHRHARSHLSPLTYE